MWKVQRFASFQNSFFVSSMLLNDPVTSDIDLVYTFPRGLKHLEWVYNKISSKFSSFPTKISSLYFLVHFFGILSSLASGHDATIHFLIFCYVNLIEYFEKSGDPESKLFSMLLIVRENTVNNVLFAKPSPRSFPQSPHRYPLTLLIFSVNAVNDVLFSKASPRRSRYSLHQ